MTAERECGSRRRHRELLGVQGLSMSDLVFSEKSSNQPAYCKNGFSPRLSAEGLQGNVFRTLLSLAMTSASFLGSMIKSSLQRSPLESLWLPGHCCSVASRTPENLPGPENFRQGLSLTLGTAAHTGFPGQACQGSSELLLWSLGRLYLTKRSVFIAPLPADFFEECDRYT